MITIKKSFYIFREVKLYVRKLYQDYLTLEEK